MPHTIYLTNDEKRYFDEQAISTGVAAKRNALNQTDNDQSQRASRNM